MKNLIWCEVTCGCCGAAANSCGYYSPELIKNLKAETKDWVEDETYRVLCPPCAAIVRAEKAKLKADKNYSDAIKAAVASGKADHILSSDKAWRSVSVLELLKSEKE